MAEVMGEEKDGISAVKAAIMALRAKAAKGDIHAIREILDRIYGRAKQPLEHSGEVTSYNVDLTKEEMKEINQTLEDEC